jgi:YidC/Oxa1 family membrane protein insertase
LNPDENMLGFVIQTTGLNGLLALSTNSLDIEWNQKMRIQEKGRKLENQYTGLYYKFLADNVEHFGEAKDEKKQISTRIKWIGYKNKFFSSVLIADDAFSSSILSATQNQTDSKYLKEFNTTTSIAFTPSKNETIGFRYFFGPNKYKLLHAYDKSDEPANLLELDKLVPMGYNWLRPVNKYFIMPIFNFLGKYMTNYGLIILFLTLIVKIVLFPLTYKSSMSQAKMRVLKPQVDELKQKFPKKEQAMELQQATMALYSSAGASPMSGCLPMLLQMPILIALYWLFPTTIELRQQSFLWAEDLSTYDAIVSWNANIPLISSFIGNHISLFCLLMTIVNLISTKMTSMMNAGQQQMAGMNMMMYMMPIMFFVFFNQNSAGLSYYFLISTLITIGQTMLFRFGVNEEKLLAQLEANKKKPKKKSGFMQRMAEMQKQQQEQLRKQQKEREKHQHSNKRRN